MKKRTKRTIKMAWKVWVRMVMAGIMCAVLVFSFGTLANGLLSDEVGYRIIQTAPDATEFTEDNSEVIKEVRYKKGEKPPADEEIKLGEGQTVQRLYEMSSGIEIAVNCFVFVCTLFVLGVFPYNVLWEMGSKDENKVRFGRAQYDKWRGFKIGVLAMIPSVVLYIFLVLGRFGLFFNNYLGFYRVLTIPFLPYFNMITSTVPLVTNMTILHFLALLPTFFFIPAVCLVAYRLGYRQFSLKEHFTYAKKETDGSAEEEI